MFASVKQIIIFRLSLFYNRKYLLYIIVFYQEQYQIVKLL